MFFRVLRMLSATVKRLSVRFYQEANGIIVLLVGIRAVPQAARNTPPR